jgi:hypothetical protein
MEGPQEQSAPEKQDNGHDAAKEQRPDAEERSGRPPKHLPRPTRR